MALGRVFNIGFNSQAEYKALIDCTPEEVQEYVSAGIAEKAWQVGDIAKGVLTTGYGAYIIGFDHNKNIETLSTPSTLGISSAWQDIISPVTKYTDNSPTNLDSETGVTATTDLMWLPSEFEVFGAITNSNPSEEFFQQQYDFFKNKAVSRVRYDFFNNKKAVKWWLRSPQFTLRYCFCAVSTSGTVTTQNANLNLGVVICFAVVG